MAHARGPGRFFQVLPFQNPQLQTSLDVWSQAKHLPKHLPKRRCAPIELGFLFAAKDTLRIILPQVFFLEICARSEEPWPRKGLTRNSFGLHRRRSVSVAVAGCRVPPRAWRVEVELSHLVEERLIADAEHLGCVFPAPAGLLERVGDGFHLRFVLQ